MPRMVGRRKDNPLGLEPRVYAKRGAFYYVHRNNRWERLGTDVESANKRARLYNDSQGLYGTMAYWLDMFIVDCEARVKSKSLAQRTLDDYRADVEPLKIYFAAPMLPTDIEPNHVQDYLQIGATADFMWAGMDLQMAMSGNQFFDLVMPPSQRFGRASGSIVNSFGQILSTLPAGTSVDYAYFNFANGNSFTGEARSYGYGGKVGLLRTLRGREDKSAEVSTRATQIDRLLADRRRTARRASRVLRDGDRGEVRRHAGAAVQG